MAIAIHSHAIVHKGARLADRVSIGPYAVIGPDVTVNKGTRIEAFTHITGHTEIGKNCHIFSHAVVGSLPQDLKHDSGDISYLVIGEGNTIREFTTINPGTGRETKTVIGDNNMIMAYSHIAHNCIVGNNNVFANGATLAGHVEVSDRAVIGGLVAIHQFCRVGTYSIIGGCSKVVQDIPPFSMCDGHPAKVHGLNAVGLRRSNFSKEKLDTLKKAFKVLFFENHTFEAARKLIHDTLPQEDMLSHLLEFIASSKRGVAK